MNEKLARGTHTLPWASGDEFEAEGDEDKERSKGNKTRYDTHEACARRGYDEKATVEKTTLCESLYALDTITAMQYNKITKVGYSHDLDICLHFCLETQSQKSCPDMVTRLIANIVLTSILRQLTLRRRSFPTS
jgi:hypothetical protein